MKKLVHDRVTESDTKITLEKLKEVISGHFNNVKAPSISIGTIFNEFMMNLFKKVDESSWNINGPSYFVMDNAKFHYNPELKGYIERSPRQLEFLPPYSLFFNPIEEAFSKLKLVVKLQHFERGKDKLIEGIVNIVQVFIRAGEKG
jgi:hypothetical protein